MIETETETKPETDTETWNIFHALVMSPEPEISRNIPIYITYNAYGMVALKLRKVASNSD